VSTFLDGQLGTLWFPEFGEGSATLQVHNTFGVFDLSCFAHDLFLSMGLVVGVVDYCNPGLIKKVIYTQVINELFQ
jgi:hypothetical protein